MSAAEIEVAHGVMAIVFSAIGFLLGRKSGVAVLIGGVVIACPPYTVQSTAAALSLPPGALLGAMLSARKAARQRP